MPDLCHTSETKLELNHFEPNNLVQFINSKILKNGLSCITSLQKL